MGNFVNFYKNQAENKGNSRFLFWLCVIFLLAVGGGLVLQIRNVSREIAEIEPIAFEYVPRAPKEPEEIVPEKRFVPGNFSMNTLKTRGCVADGILNGYGGKKKQSRELIDRSECVYLHRALETWLENPDFEKIADQMAQFEKEGLVFGMFLAEAIRRDKEYDNPKNGEEIDLGDMCKEGTEDRWGYRSCVPDISSGKYRDYLGYLTRSAMDIGVQSFLFGQIHLQDGKPYAESKMPNVIKEMRQYAKSKGLQIVIGAQTNSITEQKYLDMFDYIEGGVGIGSDGQIEDGPCWSRMGSCWALLWHDKWSGKAKNVFLHLDWSGVHFDDMSSFARLTKEERAVALRNLYRFFVSKNMGFLMPFLAPLYPENDGCQGPSKRFYSPDDRYKCQDESTINAIFNGN
jgi:hypothetical protein